MRVSFIRKDFPDFKEITDQLHEYFTDIVGVKTSVWKLGRPTPRLTHTSLVHLYGAMIDAAGQLNRSDINLIYGSSLERLVDLREMVAGASDDLVLGHSICLTEKIVHDDLDPRTFIVYRSEGDELRKAFRSSGLTRPFDRTAILVSSDPDEAADQIRQEIEGVLGIEEDNSHEA